MMDELDKRERMANQDRTQEQQAQAKLQMEIERLRRQAGEREAKAQEERRAAAAAASGAADVSDEMREKLTRTLKVGSWEGHDLRHVIEHD